MFGFLKLKPPLSPWEKAWTEHRMNWFADQLGFGRMLETETLTPDNDRIPTASNYDGAIELLKFLGSWMKLDTSSIRLQVHGEVVTPDQFGSYDSQSDSAVVQVHHAQFENRDSLIATLAWQLAHKMMSDGTLRDVKLADQGWTTDLLPVFLGMGIIAANQVLRKPREEASHFAWWGMRQRAYLPGRVFGYAMALQACTREEDSPPWSGFLRQDVRSAFRDGLKYLQKTKDTTFSRDSARQPRNRLSIDALTDELQDGSPSRKISAMWELSQRPTLGGSEPNTKISELLMDRLRDKQAEVRAVAASTLPLIDRSPHAAQDVADALNDSSDEVRIAAAGALAAFVGVDDETLVNDLSDALKDSERLVVFNAARSLNHYRVAAQPATKGLLRRLRQAMVECRDDDTYIILSAIDSIVDDTPKVLREFLGESDQEFYDFALQMLEQISSHPLMDDPIEARSHQGHSAC